MKSQKFYPPTVILIFLNFLYFFWIFIENFLVTLIFVTLCPLPVILGLKTHIFGFKSLCVIFYKIAKKPNIFIKMSLLQMISIYVVRNPTKKCPVNANMTNKNLSVVLLKSFYFCFEIPFLDHFFLQNMSKIVYYTLSPSYYPHFKY